MSAEVAISVICIALACVVVLLALTWIPAMCIKKAQLSDLRRRCRNKLALTYDDGPGLSMTPELVEILSKHKAKATFFLVGFRAERHPEMCDLLVQRGHELGCHTHMHKKPWRIAPWQTALDVHEGYRAMSRWISIGASFRPPFGKLTTWSWLAARRHGAALCWWTCDGCDTAPQIPEPAAVVQRVVEQGGAVILMHSHDRGMDRQRYVLQLTEMLLQTARKHNLEICTMSQVLGPALA